MYSITTTDKNGRVKSHTVTSPELAAAVCRDLEARYGECMEITHTGTKPVYDPGGTLLLNQPQIDAGFISVDSQHRDFLYHHLLDLMTRPPRVSEVGPYYKLHGAWHCICLTPEEAGLTLAALSL